MAKSTSLELFIGTDKQFVFHIKTEDEKTAIDIGGFALSFMVKRLKADPDNAALITKTTAGGISIGGTFNPSPGSNLQRATVTLADTDSELLAEGKCHWELKRTDDGFETPLGYGIFELIRGVHRA